VGTRSFLNAGTNVLPGERKFLDYAFPPTHVALDVVSNTGGRVGWHNSPLPGPFDFQEESSSSARADPRKSERLAASSMRRAPFGSGDQERARG
jgi:hypothetical protein